MPSTRFVEPLKRGPTRAGQSDPETLVIDSTLAVDERAKVCDAALKFAESGRVNVEGIVIRYCSSNNAREALETAAGTDGIKATLMP